MATVYKVGFTLTSYWRSYKEKEMQDIMNYYINKAISDLDTYEKNKYRNEIDCNDLEVEKIE